MSKIVETLYVAVLDQIYEIDVWHNNFSYRAEICKELK